MGLVCCGLTRMGDLQGKGWRGREGRDTLLEERGGAGYGLAVEECVAEGCAGGA